jgi:hypothetical protein
MGNIKRMTQTHQIFNPLALWRILISRESNYTIRAARTRLSRRMALALMWLAMIVGACV